VTRTQESVNCTECGALIDTSADTSESRVSCPNCGGSKRTIQFSAAEMTPSNYMLDTFVAHKLSRLTECGAKELPMNPTRLNAFILRSIFNANLTARSRAYIFNFLRRAEGALSAYLQARKALIEYLETPRNVVSPYFTALLNFEVCISQCYQGYELLKTASGTFKLKGAGVVKRLRQLYNVSKHMNKEIRGGQIPTEATAAIWITNHGLESKGVRLSFDELLATLRQMDRVAEELSKAGPPS
jgi:DNA-directed RNA polymerase subunit RPC12/RpoP